MLVGQNNTRFIDKKACPLASLWLRFIIEVPRIYKEIKKTKRVAVSKNCAPIIWFWSRPLHSEVHGGWTGYFSDISDQVWVSQHRRRRKRCFNCFKFHRCGPINYLFLCVGNAAVRQVRKNCT